MTAVSAELSSGALRDLAYLAAAGYNDNFTAQGATLQQRLAASGWTLLDGGSLAPSSGQFATSGVNQGYFVNSNAAGFVAVKDGTLAIVFRGSDDTQDFIDAVFDQDGHYALLQPLVLSALAYAQANGIEQVYVAGHSLGGSMAEWFAAAAGGYADAADLQFLIATFGSPGTRGAPSPPAAIAYEVVNLQHSEDSIPDLNYLHNGPVVTVERDGSDQHSSILYYNTLSQIALSPLGNLFAMDPAAYYVGLGDAATDRFPADLANQDLSRALYALGVGGNDTLIGTSRADLLDGGDGNDTLDGGSAGDVMAGGGGNDTFVVDTAADMILEDAGGGSDLVRAKVSSYGLGANLETLVFIGGGAFAGSGNALANSMFGGSGADTLEGASGADSLFGASATDSLYGDSGSDYLSGGSGVDSLLGGVGDDVLDGGDGSDSLFGGSGLDYLVGLGGDDGLWGGSGADSLVAGAGDDWVHGDGGDDDLSGRVGIDRVYGGSGDDLVSGDNGDDTLFGDSGLDRLYGGFDRDSLYGGSGNDVGYGDGHGDFLAGAQGDDTLFGGLGPDWLNGNDGADTLYGDAGQDTLRGRSGADVFVVDSQPNPRDQVTDFALAEGDRLDLSLIIPGATGDLYQQGFLRLVEVTISGTDYLEVQIDRDGGGDAFQRAILLQDVTADQISGTEFYFT
jgi:Ca2+-binding RTX toxin-like protein